MILSNHEITASQVGMLLQTIIQLSRIADTDDEGNPILRDGGCRLAVQTSLIQASNRLDAILGDAARWALPERDSSSILLSEVEARSKLLGQRLSQEEALKSFAAALTGLPGGDEGPEYGGSTVLLPPSPPKTPANKHGRSKKQNP